MLRRVPILIVFSIVAVGCAGKGETVNVNLKNVDAGSPRRALSQGLTVAVEPFTDKRTEKKLGRRTHLWGGETYFAIADGKPEDKVAKVIADYLTSRGWKATVVPSGAPADANLIIRGQINELSADAKSGFGHTKIDVKSQLTLQTEDQRTRNTSRMTLNGERSRTVVFFDEEDVEEELNKNFEESLNRLIADARANELLPTK